MATLGPSPFAWLEFDEKGDLVDNSAVKTIDTMLSGADVKDVVFLSHGWKNDKQDATKLYGDLWQNVCDGLKTKDAGKIVVVGVLWPAKKYDTDFDEKALEDVAAGGALAAGGGGAAEDLSEADFTDLLEDFSELLGPRADEVVKAAKAAAEEMNGEKSTKLVDSAADAVNLHGPPDPELAGDADPITAADPQLLLTGLVAPPQLKLDEEVGTAQGLGSALKGIFNGPRAAVARFLNQITYYEMKKRAGIVGASLAKDAIAKLKPDHAVRLHLVGHSFGARLVTAAASALPAGQKFDFFSLTLLQGAFSHNALAKQVKPGTPGAFANVVGRPTGPITITHTHNDKACTLAYALASRLSRDVAAAIGDKNDEFGAMGANGAQKLPPAALAPDHANGPFAPKSGKVNRFLADKYIVKTQTTDAHNNVTNQRVGELVAAVLET